MPERLARSREPLPNLRGEDETELQHLTGLIENVSWILCPGKHTTCVIGRILNPRDSACTYIASLYSMGKGGVKCLDFGPEKGKTRKEALTRLLSLVEEEIGGMMLRDAKRSKAEAQARRGSGSG
ncbi:hypothetical protein EJ02DRAFT_368243 [Clathrospora elynae]|uniref:Uncharacterized protein n=1 Tax=Clathrospora elynae TaxID=706981 RepID=A0A6A5T111_9PLEO|nr:hypothetical protein EJ02DRAFT_368243 [Clathrospora elynae]